MQAFLFRKHTQEPEAKGRLTRPIHQWTEIGKAIVYNRQLFHRIASLGTLVFHCSRDANHPSQSVLGTPAHEKATRRRNTRGAGMVMKCAHSGTTSAPPNH